MDQKPIHRHSLIKFISILLSVKKINISTFEVIKQELFSHSCRSFEYIEYSIEVPSQFNQRIYKAIHNWVFLRVIKARCRNIKKDISGCLKLTKEVHQSSSLHSSQSIIKLISKKFKIICRRPRRYSAGQKVQNIQWMSQHLRRPLANS